MAKVLILLLIVANDLQARADDNAADYESEEDSDVGGHEGYEGAKPRIPRGGSGSGDFEKIPDVDRRDLQARADDNGADYESEEDSDVGGHEGYEGAKPRIPRGGSGSGDFEKLPDVDRRDLQARRK
uniref:Hypothetical secreted protein n=1 Tax=Rhipicephalus sanguineus TaxID=34632 RepID=C9W1J0_RHISA